MTDNNEIALKFDGFILVFLLYVTIVFWESWKNFIKNFCHQNFFSVGLESIGVIELFICYTFFFQNNQEST